MRTITHLIIHHTGVAADSHGSTLKGVDDYHRFRNWGTIINKAYAAKSSLGYYVQYHYFIDKDGNLTQTREDNEIGWHATKSNPYSIGICVAGDFRREKPTNKQLGTLRSIIYELRQRYSIHPVNILGHRAVVWRTKCPGKNFSPALLGRIIGNEYAPGDLIKHKDSPKVYVVNNDKVPVWIQDEQTFNTFWGDWDQVQEVPKPIDTSYVVRVVDNNKWESEPM